MFTGEKWYILNASCNIPNMLILGIETSCDETAVCAIDASGLFEDGSFTFSILGNSLLSQADKHAKYGGVYPNLAKREHARNLVPILQTALGEAGMLEKGEGVKIKKEKIEEARNATEREPELFANLLLFIAQYKKPNIDAIAVTVGPGLEPALWVGINFARALSCVWDIPVTPVNHMEGHVVISALFGKETSGKEVAFPALALLISGGHTELVYMDTWGAYRKIGETRDDAVGEAFDKVARLLGLPYPGGPEISRLARKAREANMAQPFALPRPMLSSNNTDFSFSGLKTAVLKIVEGLGELSDMQKSQLSREFEDSVSDIFVSKVRTALIDTGARTLIIGGGVSANAHLREKLAELLQVEFSDTTLLLPPPQYATDNALMIALAGYFHAARGVYADIMTLRANGNLSLS